MVLAFGIVGIIFDIVALIAYFMPDRIWRRTKIDEKNELVGLSGDELSMFSAVVLHSFCPCVCFLKCYWRRGCARPCNVQKGF
jgi:hypothetical protein